MNSGSGLNMYQGVTDVEASVSFIAEFILKYGNNYVHLHSCSLETALQEACFATCKSRKLVALYFHNESDPFSKMLCPALVSGDIRTVLENSFYVLGWDVSNTLYHDALKKSLDDNMDYNDLAKYLLIGKHAALFVISPVENSITTLSKLHGSTVTSSDVLKTLKQLESKFREETKIEMQVTALKDRLKSEYDINSLKFQQLMCDRLGDRDYDSFQYDEHEYLKQKIGFALYGPPSEETGYNEKQNICIEKTYEKIRQCNNLYTEWQDEIFVSFIYNCLEPLADEKLKRAEKYKDYNPNTDILPVPLYVVRKCRGSANPCRIFIDSDNRQYATWHDYKQTNKLHKCSMILPKEGRYSVDESGEVKLEVHLSPSCGLTQTILTKTDTAGAFAGIASGVVFIATMIPAISVAPVVLGTATVTGATVGAYALVRSMGNLYDKYIHGENLSFADSEARGAYISIVAGTLGFAGAGATAAVSQLAASGINIGQGAQMTVNAINVMSVGVNGVAVGNSMYQVVNIWVKEQQTPSLLTIVQLSSSILFFGNSVYNFRTVDTVIKETQTNTLREINETLSNRQRKMFNKITKETIRVQSGDVQAGRAEVISAINKIPNKKDFFAVLQRNNKLFNQKGIKFSTENGEIHLNGIPVDLFKFASMSKTQRTQFLIDLPSTTQSPAVNNVSNVTQITNTIKMVFDLENNTVAKYGHLIHTAASCSALAEVFLKDFSAIIQEKILRITKALIDKLDENIFKSEYFAHLNKEPFGIIMKLVIDFLKMKMNNYQEQYEKEKQIAQQSPNFDEENFDKKWGVSRLELAKRAVYWFEKSVNVFVTGEFVDESCLRELIGYVMNSITQMVYDYWDGVEKRQRRNINSKKNVQRITCPICGGYYFNGNN